MKKIYLLFPILFFTFLLGAQTAHFNTGLAINKSCMPAYQYKWSTPAAQRWNDIHAAAANSRSDTFDILHYTIHLNITDLTSDTIRGYTTLHFTPRINGVITLPLDLLHMTIDSVVENNGQLFHSYTDTLLLVSLPGAMNIGDTSDVTVYYHGKPQMDPSGWGGFYFSGGYAFNLGVGFQTNPVNFGRAWYPCFDNFVERATYTFVIGSNSGKIAYCNGVLGADTTDMNGVRWRTWNLNETIPSYLASVSVAAYTQVNWTHTGIYGSYPIVLTALPADTTNMKNSFVHLNNALDAFEMRYGQFMWPRVGYCLVPFNNGAMEHATNISYPRIAANGLLTYEANIMAHELSHHWFGDLATCRTEGDMWLNEGWASYSQFVFTEWVYGRAAYNAAVLANHDDMVHFVDIREPLYGAVSGVPHAYTYGDHVYLKGADVAHTLRGYMGDTLFWAGLHYHLQQNMYKDVSSADFRDDLIASSGLSNLNDFFNDWVFNPGWPQFSVDSVQSVPNGPNYDVTVYVRQKLKNAPAYFTNVPLEISYYKSDWSRTIQPVMVSGQYSTFTITLPYDPVMTALDVDGKISDAISDENLTITTTGAHNLVYGRVNLTVNTLPDSAFIRVEHNWVKPDSIKINSNNYHISSLRYWHIDGIFPAGFYATARFYYDGRTNINSNTTSYWLDNDLTVPNGDSIILLYRRNAADDWHEYPHYTKFIIGSASTSKYGYVLADSLVAGEYCFANGVSHVLGVVNYLPASPPEVVAFPNPSFSTMTVEWDGGTNDPVQIDIFDMNGKRITSASATNNAAQFDVSSWAGGTYFVNVSQKGKLLGKKQVVIVH